MHFNNRDDLLQPSFTFKFQIFGGLHITQSNIYDEAFIAKIVNH